MSRTALVTLAIGEPHRRLWNTNCKAAWEAYAARHGYDVICLDEPLDTSPRALRRSPAWQKLLVLRQPFAKGYDRVVWVDSDVLINPAAPAIDASVPPDRVGAVDDYAAPSPELHAEALRKLHRHWESLGVSFHRDETASDFYAAYGLPAHHESVVHSGVLVLSPSHHRELLERVYFEYEGRPGDLWGEWRPLSYELLEAGVVEWLDPRFNCHWPAYKALHFPFLLNHPEHPRARASAAAALRDVHFLHFSGSHHEIALARPGERVPAPGREPRTAATAALNRAPDTPVAMLMYARPQTTRQVLGAVRAVRPRRLLAVADAAPADRPDLAERCEETRRLIDEIDWDCEVTTHYAERHMGLNRRVESGLDWVFEQVAEAIVLEDDCVPDPTFFRFCDELLARHRHDESVATVSGTTFDFGIDGGGSSYRFSRYPLIWGWATWRRAWDARHARLASWPELRDSRWLDDLFDDPHAVAYWSSHFDQAYRGEGSWDFGWVLSSWIAGALAAVPSGNLVSNVGFGDGASHTHDDALSPYADLARSPMRFPLVHPERLEADGDADRLLEETVWSGNVSRMFARLRATRARRTPAPL
jgi:hypothetical protein